MLPSAKPQTECYANKIKSKKAKNSISKEDL
jgi:hypothetical protein